MPKESQNLFIKKSLTRHLGAGIQSASDHSETSRTSTPTVSEDEGVRADRQNPTPRRNQDSIVQSRDDTVQQRKMANKHVKDDTGKEVQTIGEKTDEQASKICVDQFQEALNNSADEAEGSSVSTSSESREIKSNKRPLRQRMDHGSRGGYHSSYRGGGGSYRGGKADRRSYFGRPPRPMVPFPHGRAPPPPPSGYIDQLPPSPRDNSQYMGHMTSPRRTPRHSESSSCGSPRLYSSAHTPPQSPRHFYESPINSPLRRHMSPFNSPPRHPASPIPRMLPPEAMHPAIMSSVIPHQQQEMFHGANPTHYNHPPQIRPMTPEQQQMLFAMEHQRVNEQTIAEQQLAYQYHVSNPEQAELIARQRAQKGQALPISIQQNHYNMQYIAHQQQGVISIGQRPMMSAVAPQIQVGQQMHVAQQNQLWQMQLGQQMQMRPQLAFGQQMPIGPHLQLGQQVALGQNIQEEHGMTLGQQMQVAHGMSLVPRMPLGQGMQAFQGIPTGQGIASQLGQRIVPQASMMVNSSSPGNTEMSQHMIQHQMRHMLVQPQAGFMQDQQMHVSGYPLQNMQQMQQMQQMRMEADQPILVPQPIHPEIGTIGQAMENTVPIQNMSISAIAPNVVPPNGKNATMHPYSFMHPDILQQQQSAHVQTNPSPAHVQTNPSPALPLDTTQRNTLSPPITCVAPSMDINPGALAPPLNTVKPKESIIPTPPLNSAPSNDVLSVPLLSSGPLEQPPDFAQIIDVPIESLKGEAAKASKPQLTGDRQVSAPSKASVPETLPKQTNKTPGLIRLPPQLPTEEELMTSPDAYTPANMKKNYWQNRQRSTESSDKGNEFEVESDGQRKDGTNKNNVEVSDKVCEVVKGEKEKTTTKSSVLLETPKKEKAPVKSKPFNLNDLGNLVTKTVNHNKNMPKTDISSTSGNVEVVLNQGYRKTQSPTAAAHRPDPSSSRNDDNWRPLSRESKTESTVSWRSTENAASASSKRVFDEDPARELALREAEAKDMSTGQQIKYVIEKLQSTSPTVRSVSESSSKSTKVEDEENEEAPWYDEADEDDINPFDVTM